MIRSGQILNKYRNQIENKPDGLFSIVRFELELKLTGLRKHGRSDRIDAGREYQGYRCGEQKP